MARYVRTWVRGSQWVRAPVERLNLSAEYSRVLDLAISDHLPQLQETFKGKSPRDGLMAHLRNSPDYTYTASERSKLPRGIPSSGIYSAFLRELHRPSINASKLVAALQHLPSPQVQYVSYSDLERLLMRLLAVANTHPREYLYAFGMVGEAGFPVSVRERAAAISALGLLQKDTLPTFLCWRDNFSQSIDQAALNMLLETSLHTGDPLIEQFVQEQMILNALPGDRFTYTIRLAYSKSLEEFEERLVNFREAGFVIDGMQITLYLRFLLKGFRAKEALEKFSNLCSAYPSLAIPKEKPSYELLKGIDFIHRSFGHSGPSPYVVPLIPDTKMFTTVLGHTLITGGSRRFCDYVKIMASRDCPPPRNLILKALRRWPDDESLVHLILDIAVEYPGWLGTSLRKELDVHRL